MFTCSLFSVAETDLHHSVTHPAGFSMAPSIAAIIASHDLRAAEYSAEIRLQLARQEIVSRTSIKVCFRMLSRESRRSPISKALL